MIDDEARVVVLAAVDAGEGSEHVLEAAAAYARGRPEAELHVLHVVEAAPRDPDVFDAVSDRALSMAHAILERARDVARERYDGVVTEHLAFGTSWQEIIRVAASVRADLVVVGTHDRTGLERWMLGSVAQKVAQKAPCAVLVARPRETPVIGVRPAARGAVRRSTPSAARGPR